MAGNDASGFRLKRAPAPLPGPAEFDPWGGDLDAQVAWRNLGELSLRQAYDLFVSLPEIYQEDFVSMGEDAFVYYFPVIDRYVREVVGSEEGHDCEVAILGRAVASRFDAESARLSDGWIAEAEDLADYVLSHLDQYSPSLKDRRRIQREWSKVPGACKNRAGGDT